MSRVDKILNYDVMAVLGQGARSMIYAVKDKKNNVFALKHVLKGENDDHRYIDQAVLEHQIAQAVNHPTLRKSFKLIRRRELLRVTEVIVMMELVDGMTLEQYQFKDMADFCQVMQKVADGLRAMHDAGYVHADIKPNNIMVDEKQVVKLIDFGQSCPIGTVKPRIQGTPDYIAPEQVKRKQITPHTDIYNLGATMYFLLTRQHVPTIMPATEGLGVGLKTDRNCPAPRTIDPKIPPALSSLVMQCIELDPMDRPQSMNQVYQRLGMSLSQVTRGNEPEPLPTAGTKPGR